MTDRKVRRHVVIDVEAVLDPRIPEKVPGRELRDGNEGRFPPPVAWQLVALGCFSFADFEPEQFGCVRGDDERAKIVSYATYLEKDRPCVVGWNTRHFDCPVIGHRALHFGIPMPWWYGSGKGPRYRYGHDALDLKDALADHGAAYTSSMSQTAILIGWPGKTFDGADVAAMHAAGKLAEIDRGCLTDVAQEAAIWLRYELLRGNIKPREWPRIASRLLSFLEKQHAATSIVAAVDRALFIGPNHAGQTAFAE